MSVSVSANLGETKSNTPGASETYEYSEALGLSTKWFGQELQARLFLDKYALKDDDGNVLEPTPDYMHPRLASEFARIDHEKYGLDFDERYSLYLESLANFQRIVPQGSPMAAIGNKYQVMSASNCVVIESPEDSIEGIMRSGEELAQLMKRRCGVGIDISTLRPEGQHVNNAAKTTSGAWSFADFFSYVTRMIAQNGRRGALMITMDVHHPDVLKFATCKLDNTKVTGANISVRYSDEFLEAVEADGLYEQRWPLEGKPVISKLVKAREVWNTIVQCATESAEPGCVFWDRMTQYLPAHSYPQFKSKSTNPCSEICLSAYDSCRLLSLNLTGYVRHPFQENAYFDTSAFLDDVETASYMSDNLVDLELELIKRIQSHCSSKTELALWQKLHDAGEQGRRVGLGTHALGDTMAQLRIKYDSDAAIQFASDLYKSFRDKVYRTSCKLAKERGTFPLWDWGVEKDNKFLKELPQGLYNEIALNGRRNIASLTQAPTGTVSMLSKTGPTFDRFGTSSGVEPLFKKSYIRRRRRQDGSSAPAVFTDASGDQWEEYEVFHPNVDNFRDTFPGEDIPDYFVEAEEIDWKQRVKLQGAEQAFIDHSISSTINLPRGTSSDVVNGIYMESWKHGLKGVTVYVDGSRDGVLITKEDKSDRPVDVTRMHSPKRPKELPCDIHWSSVKGESYIALVGKLNGEPYELFGVFPSAMSIPKKFKQGKIVKQAKGKYQLVVENGKSIVVEDIGSLSSPEISWTSRLISTSLRHGTPLDFLCEQLSKDGAINDFNKVIARVLKKYLKDGQKVRSSTKCPDCAGDNMIYQEGCLSCADCGFAKCG